MLLPNFAGRRIDPPGVLHLRDPGLGLPLLHLHFPSQEVPGTTLYMDPAQGRPIDLFTSPARDIELAAGSDGMHEIHKRGRNDFAPECRSVAEFIGCVLRGYARASMPAGSGADALKRLQAAMGADGVRLRSLRLIGETIDGVAGRLLCEMVCMGGDDVGLRCLHLCDCDWYAGAMEALSPAMLWDGVDGRLDALLVEDTRESIDGMPMDCVKRLGTVLQDARCSVRVLSLSGLLGYNTRSSNCPGPEQQTLIHRNAYVGYAIGLNSSVRYLKTGLCFVGAGTLQAWTDALASSRTLVQVHVNLQPMSPKGYDAMDGSVARIVRENRSIRDLVLLYEIRLPLAGSPTAIDALRAAIRQNQALRSLGIAYNSNYYLYHRDRSEFYRDYFRTVDAVIDNPRIVHFEWTTGPVDHVDDYLIPTVLPRLKAMRSRQSRMWAMVGHRRAAHAERDAGLVWRAAAEGRPLELAKRLGLGVMAGGAERKVQVGWWSQDAQEAAVSNGHDECALLVRRSLARELNRRSVYFGWWSCLRPGCCVLS